MALPKKIEHTAEIIAFPIVPCACGCGNINLREHAYIYSRATGEYYADEVCLIRAMADDYDLDDWKGLRVLFMDHWMTESQFLDEMEVVKVD